jgi:O-antigen/teichoic acid export membrane protein
LVGNHLAYGKWVIGERLLFWLQTSIFFLELPLVADLHASAAYRAVTTLAMPANMMMMAVGSVLLPTLVRAQATSTQPQWVRLLVPGAVLTTLVLACLLVGFGHEVGHVLFAGQYDNDLTVTLLAVVALGTVLAAVVVVLEAQLRATLRVRQILIARVAAAAVLLLVGIELTRQLDLLGAAIALDLTYVATGLAHWSMNWWRRRAYGLTR